MLKTTSHVVLGSFHFSRFTSHVRIPRLVPSEDRCEQSIRRFDLPGHLFGFCVGLHVFLGIVGQVGEAAGRPGVQELLAPLIQLVTGIGLREGEEFQGFGEEFLGHVTESGKSIMSLSI
jgi:hypothetical protein